ncbi:hypothetical protein HZ994_10360 [Akkermansiaceae bacterium]|nr:hypothetical protein HZ994_10360 [Akkermansiaceae bacterium]
MKWNTTSASAACLTVGLAGFLAGKISTGNGSAGGGEADELIERARQVSSGGTAAGKEGAGMRRDAAGRPVRAGASRAGTTFDERLTDMEEIVRGENALDRGRAMLAWIDSLAPDEFESAVARFRSLGITDARMGEYAMLLTAWAQVDPTAALAYTTENTRGGMATGTVLAAWASRDPESAIAWAEANHEGDEANPYMAGIIRALAETNPTRATELLERMPFSSERGQALTAMIPHLTRMGPESARQWISALSDERLRDGATARIAEELAKTDPAGTASWLLSNLGEASTRSVDEVFEEWAKKDKAAAMSSFASLPAGDARSRALRGLVTIEARENPQAAAKLMDTYPADVDERMVYHFMWNSFDDAPAVALSQAPKITDERNRNRMYQRALGSWLERDQPAAQRWIDSANLPESVLQSLSNRNNP